MVGVLVVGALPPPIGGVTTHIKRLLKHSCGDARVDIHVLDLKKKVLVGVNGEVSNPIKIIESILFSDVVHVQISSKLKVIVAIFFRILCKKVIYTHHNRVVGSAFFFRAMCFLCHKVVLVNPDLDKPVKSDNFVIVPAFLPPVDTPGLRKDVRDFISGFSRVIAINAFSLNYIDGEEVYGVDLVVKACEIIAKKGKLSDTCVVFFDPSNSYSDYDFGCLSGSGAPTIKRFSGSDLSYFDLLLKSTLSLRPTRTDGDALSVRESLYAGVPVIASDCTARPKSSILFENGNAEALAAAIIDNLDGSEVLLDECDKVNFYETLVGLYRSSVLN